MKTDIEIAQEAEMLPIKEVAAKLEITEDDLELYGKYKAKITDEYLKNIEDRPNGKLILVTAINPTPAEATVVINSEVVNEVTVPYGSVVDYVVSCDGYESKADVFEITKDEFLEVVLDENTTDTTEPDISI